MSWSDNLASYLACAKAEYGYAALFTIDGKTCFANCGSDQVTIAESEAATLINSAKKGLKSATTVAGNKYFYLMDADGISAYKKGGKCVLLFTGGAYACVIIADTEPRVIMKSAVSLREQLTAAGMA